MTRKTFSVLPTLFTLLTLGAFGTASHAQSAHRVASSGGFVYQGAYVAALVNASTVNGVDSGVISLTTATDHLWGFVDHIDWVSPTEAHVFAHVYGQAATLEVDVVNKGAQPMIAFCEMDDATDTVMAESGEMPDGTLAYVPMRGRTTMQ